MFGMLYECFYICEYRWIVDRYVSVCSVRTPAQGSRARSASSLGLVDVSNEELKLMKHLVCTLQRPYRLLFASLLCLGHLMDLVLLLS